MKKIVTASLLAIATISGFLLDNQPIQAHSRRYNHYLPHGYYPFYRSPISYCYPVTHWLIDEDPAYHPQAYADGYRQGQESARRGNKYKPRTAGGEFSRGFNDGYSGREFAGQKQVVPNEYKPYTTSECGWY
ncbi:hypothetical protein [Brasilonema sp. UFV-L1]|uniref:hypothetical protein n=1 Tax=Brasilonema sp. UFV-L1 TaxID=2234130 RepID=UPI00145D446E|nr:hypothetical protein [Brasilonema sp. UFV-L1]NMG05499.1 hypothetical protein [Brasilonema sp. UFV-L1]